MKRPPRLEQRPLGPRLRQLRKRLLRAFSKRFVHRHRVFRLRIGDRSYKRIRFGDSWLAERAARGLMHFRGSGLTPELEARFDEELVVEFVEGSRLTRFDVASAEPLAAFFAGIHARGARRVPTEESGASGRARLDIHFLRTAGVIDAPCAEGLERALERLAPDEVLVGWDYTDAVPRNFVRRDDGRTVGIDVEAIRSDALVGIGMAKSLARGEPGFRDAFLAAFRKESEIDLEPGLPFVELCFQLAWLKNRCLKGSRLDVRGLARFAAPGDVQVG